MSKFKIGDTIIGYDGTTFMKGIIIDIPSQGSPIMSIIEAKEGVGHNCSGLLSNGRGWFLHNESGFELDKNHIVSSILKDL